MIKKRQEVEKAIEKKYVKEPSFQKYVSTIYTTKPKIRKELYKIQKAREKKYYKQEAEIISGIKPTKREVIIKAEKAMTKARRAKISKAAKATIKGIIKPKLFKKPTFKPIKKLSARKLIQQMGREQGALVREVENPYADPIQDTRSQFFRETFTYEKKKAFGGFL